MDARNAIIRMVTCSRVQMSTAPRHPNNQHASGPAHGLCNSSNWHYPFRSQFAGRNTRTWSFQRNIKCLYVHMTCWRTEDHFKIIISSGFVRYISHRIKASISIPGKQKVFLIAPCPPMDKARNRNDDGHVLNYTHAAATHCEKKKSNFHRNKVSSHCTKIILYVRFVHQPTTDPSCGSRRMVSGTREQRLITLTWFAFVVETG